MSIEIYRKFPSVEDSDYLTQLLIKNNIPFKLIDYSNQPDITFTGQNLDYKVELKADLSDFPKIDKLLEEQSKLSFNNIDKDHYFFEYSNEELTDVILAPEEWHNYDYQVAKLILKDRGIEISDKFIETIKFKKLKESGTNESYPVMWIIVGYISAFFGGILGLAIGLSLWLMRKKLHDGTKVFIYKENIRTHGKIISLIGFFMFILIITIRVNMKI
ncbi:MAG TPA: hypothetical protein P5514_04820 [Bacteroidales bacterium]|nr:hypothetical protein [Bacteroidales bacterium]HRX96244.1 hypothetical protein [Bacteroidales bacterium]